jgi:7,8-dihydro-6-hydroxymethylpterin-pyrophosphokinase
MYRTQPLGDVRKPAFVNAVAGLLTQATTGRSAVRVASLWSASSGASRRANAGVPRLIDLDLLMVGRERAALTDADAATSRESVPRAFRALSTGRHRSPTSKSQGVGTVRALRERVANRGIERL